MKKKYTMKLRKVSTHSYSVTIPKEIIKAFKWQRRQKLVLSVEGSKKEIKIVDWQK